MKLGFQIVGAWLAGMLSCMTGCDPGWSYHVPDPMPGPAKANAGDGLSIHAEGRLFSSSLWVDLDVRNDDPNPLAFTEAPFRVLDSARQVLPWRQGQPPAKPCSNHDERLVILKRGDDCRLQGAFEVRPLSGIFFGRNDDLKTVTVIVDGIAREGKPISRSVVLGWD
jgi:hypothetical protein